MSATTPAASTPDASGSAAASSPAPVQQPAATTSTANAAPATPTASAAPNTAAESSTGLSQTDQLVLDYLRTRGYQAAEQAFRDSLQASSSTEAKPSTPTSISSDDLAKKIAVYAQKPGKPAGENALKDSATVLSELGTMGNPSNIQNLIASIGPVGSEEILSLDPTDKQEGFRELEAWVDGSLDMYRVRLCQQKLYALENDSIAARIQAYIVSYILSFLSRPHPTWVQGGR